MASEEEKTPKAPKIICFFAHKGGVSKTTNVYHLGWMLARQHHQRVVLVDADPQCNLTHTLIKSSRLDLTYRNNIERGNIYSAVRDIHHGFGTRDGKDVILPAECVQIERCTEDLETDGQLWLLPGSIDLSTLEAQITIAHNMNSPDSFPILRNIPGVFRELFKVTAQYYWADYVIVDMGPSIGELNKNLFFSSDYFVIPAAPDAYCRSTIATMNEILPKWSRIHKRLAEVTAEQFFPVKPEMTKLLGVIMSLFATAGKNKNPVKQAQIFMDLVEAEIHQTLIPTLQSVDMCSIENPDDAMLGGVPNFLSLQQLSQRANYPVYCIPTDKMLDLDADGNVKPMSNSEQKRNSERGEYFHAVYDEMAQRFLRLTDKLL